MHPHILIISTMQQYTNIGKEGSRESNKEKIL